MKRKAGKPRAKDLHQPIPELVKAEAMPEEKRRKGRNIITPPWLRLIRKAGGRRFSFRPACR